MNTSILGRIFLSSSQNGLSGEIKLWVMPAILEVYGFSSILKAFDTFDAGKHWYVWLSYAALGTVLIPIGILWAVFRKRIAVFWNKRFGKEKAVALSAVTKPTHNVQFVGFEQLDDDHFNAAVLVFRNVPNGKLLGKFLAPRLRVIYYHDSTGQEIDDFYSVNWRDEEEGIEDISAAGRKAGLASFFNKWRVAGEDGITRGSPFDLRRSIELPAGKLRIVATLYGNYVSSSPVLTVTGVLTLGEDGSASFSKHV